jgi:FHA domain
VVVPEYLAMLWRRLQKDPAGARASVTSPTLVWEAPRRASAESGHWVLTEPGSGPGVPNPGEALIFPVAKRPGAAAAAAAAPGVTIGRLGSNDVVLDDSSVSRVHAFVLRDDRTGRWFVTDTGSRNGTRLNGLRLEPNKRALLQDGAELLLGDASLRFFLPEGLWEFIQDKGR